MAKKKEVDKRFLMLGVRAADALSSINVGRSGQDVSHPSYGETVTEKLRNDAVARTPLADKITYGVAKDIVGKWWKIESPDDKEIDDRIQLEVERLNLKNLLIDAVAAERKDGYSVLAFQGSSGSLQSERPETGTTNLEQVLLFKREDIDEAETEKTVITDAKKIHYGLPEHWFFSQGAGRAPLKVHWTRCVHVISRPDIHRWQGKSILELCWDDITLYKNCLASISQVLWKAGYGPVIVTVPGKMNYDELQDLVDDQIGDFHQMSIFAKSEDHQIESLDVHTIEPTPYLNAMLTSIAMGIGLPRDYFSEDTIKGVTGSETQERKYHSGIENMQNLYYTNAVKQIVTQIEPSLTNSNYKIVWNPAFKLTQTQEMRARRLESQAKVNDLQFMTINEMREANKLDPIPEGDVILPLEQIKSTRQAVQPQSGKSKSKRSQL